MPVEFGEGAPVSLLVPPQVQRHQRGQHAQDLGAGALPFLRGQPAADQVLHDPVHLQPARLLVHPGQFLLDEPVHHVALPQ
jgi:hypothetical protein